MTCRFSHHLRPVVKCGVNRRSLTIRLGERFSATKPRSANAYNSFKASGKVFYSQCKFAVVHQRLETCHLIYVALHSDPRLPNASIDKCVYKAYASAYHQLPETERKGLVCAHETASKANDARTELKAATSQRCKAMEEGLRRAHRDVCSFLHRLVNLTAE